MRHGGLPAHRVGTGTTLQEDGWLADPLQLYAGMQTWHDPRDDPTSFRSSLPEMAPPARRLDNKGRKMRERVGQWELSDLV